ncbi:MAG: biotin/lipoyl-binding protein [Clostridiales bacterium]|nr:biotin/lipoyl-binding protein [Clostridiales bacterium]
MKYVVTLNGKNYEVEVEETEAVITAVTDVVQAAAPAAVSAAPVQTAAPAAAPAAPVGDGVKVLAPMPGNILSVNITNGQAVKKGEVLFILEAMKMENDIVAPEDGTVKQILVQKGATVDTDAVLALI